jgi:hypothetical protein
MLVPLLTGILLNRYIFSRIIPGLNLNISPAIALTGTSKMS